MEGAGAVVDTTPARRAAGPTSHAWIAGLMSAVAGLAAHLAAGGRAPGILIVVALAALLGMAASIAGRRRLPGWAVLLAAGLAQQLLHLAFAAFSTASGFSLPGHHGDASAPAPDAAAPAGPGAHDLHLMLHLHVAAALVVSLAVTQWTKVVSMVRGRRSGVERSPGNADA